MLNVDPWTGRVICSDVAISLYCRRANVLAIALQMDIEGFVGHSHCPVPKLDRCSVSVLENSVVFKTKL